MERSNCAVGVAKKRKSQKVKPATQKKLKPKKNQAKKTKQKKRPDPNPKPRKAKPQKPKPPSTNAYKTVIPTGAGRRFFSSFVRERVGLRSGGISLRFLAQAKPRCSPGT